MQLLKSLCGLHGPSGDEGAVKDFILNYVAKNSDTWACQPAIITGPEFQDCVILKFGNPSTAVFAHMDSIGFTVRYEDQLVLIGSPEAKTGIELVGKDNLGPIECQMVVNEGDQPRYKFGRGIQRGTNLVYKCNFREEDEYVQSCYLDNRLGVYNCLKLAETMKNGVLVFSCWEEHGGGAVPYLIKYLYEQLNVSQCLISDITWVTDGVHPGKGVVISMRDRNIPRKKFIDKVIGIANSSTIPFQLEVEGSGSSDGRELQVSPYPIDWCFIGAPEQNVHSPNEKVHKKDIKAMIALYSKLLDDL